MSGYKLSLASFPGPVRSSLAVQNSRRGEFLCRFHTASDKHAGPGNKAKLPLRLVPDELVNICPCCSSFVPRCNWVKLPFLVMPGHKANATPSGDYKLGINGACDIGLFDGGCFAVCAQGMVPGGSWMGQSSEGFWSHKWKTDMNSNGDTEILTT